MSEINIKFDTAVEKLIYSGKKQCTTRETRHGVRGDTFKDSRGLKYEIIAVIETKLKTAIEKYYGLEGYKSPREFFDEYCRLKGIGKEQMYDFTSSYANKPAFIHFFRLTDLEE